jgi:hypothetical protein
MVEVVASHGVVELPHGGIVVVKVLYLLCGVHLILLSVEVMMMHID